MKNLPLFKNNGSLLNMNMSFQKKSWPIWTKKWQRDFLLFFLKNRGRKNRHGLFILLYQRQEKEAMACFPIE